MVKFGRDISVLPKKRLPVRQSVRIYQEILSEEYVKKTIWAGDWYTFCHHLLYILQPNMEVTRYNKNVSGRAIFLRLLGSLWIWQSSTNRG